MVRKRGGKKEEEVEKSYQHRSIGLEWSKKKFSIGSFIISLYVVSMRRKERRWRKINK